MQAEGSWEKQCTGMASCTGYTLHTLRTSLGTLFFQEILILPRENEGFQTSPKK
jgi:hypothetical protein